jgi:hypothetical protein
MKRKMTRRENNMKRKMTRRENASAKIDAQRLRNRRLSDSKFRRLMAQASTKLSLKDNEDDLPILDLYGSTHESMDELIQLCINGLVYERPSILNEYSQMIRGRRLESKDKLAILTYLRSKREGRKPFCLLSENEKTNEFRKVVKPSGDIKSRPFRIIPDDEYFLEVHGEKRTKFDKFDRMSLDEKIEWARYANLILNIGEKNNIGQSFRLRVQNAFDYESVIFAMKYACKMSKIPEFKGDFANTYWILLRVYKFHNNMTNKEYSVYYRMALEHLNLLEKRKTLSVISPSEAVERLIPMMKRSGVYKKYMSCKKEDAHVNLKLAGDLLLQRT